MEMKNRNVLFVIHDIEYGDHMAISYLSAIAKEQGFDTSLCILSCHDIDEMMNRIKPGIVAYSANIMGYDNLVSTNKRIASCHEFISIMGGPQPTFFPEFFEKSGIDVFCVGEGEYAFSDFLSRVEKGEPYDDILNLITKKGVNAVRPLIKDLDQLPMPDRSLTLANSFLKDTSKKTFYTTRGCPFKCYYCCNNYYQELYKGKGKVFRRFSVERVISEIEYVKTNFVTEFIKFGDDLFALKKDAWLEEFAEQYQKRIGLPFNCYLRLDTVNEEMLSLLKKTGCHSVHLSVDSLSDNVRENILGRKWRDVDMEASLKMIHDCGINTWVNFMLAAPSSTLQDDLATIDFCRRTRITYPNFTSTAPVKKTKLYDYCLSHNMIDKEYPGDMEDCTLKSPLKCFSEKEKNIRYNIYLLGAIAAKMPQPIDKVIMLLIKYVPSNILFTKLHDWYWNYSVKNKIFKIKV